MFLYGIIKKANILTNNMYKTIDDFINSFKPNKQKEIFCLNNFIENSIELVNLMFNHHQIKLVIKFNNKRYMLRDIQMSSPKHW
jgi:hypothetical protein